jgi:protein gp37
MADVFEDRRDLDIWRQKLWDLIGRTPELDWLLLAKRPEVVNRLVPWKNLWPCNVWLGTTVEDQESAEARLSYLAELPATIRFISAEPLLGPLDVGPWLGSTVNWVIAGGESGPKARAPDPAWFRSLLRQCKAAEVPFHFKQWGDWAPAPNGSRRGSKTTDDTTMLRVGRKAAGRLLDGAMWDGLPNGLAA